MTIRYKNNIGGKNSPKREVAGKTYTLEQTLE